MPTSDTAVCTFTLSDDLAQKGSLLEAWQERSELHVALVLLLRGAQELQPQRCSAVCLIDVHSFAVRHGAGWSLPLSHDSSGFSLDLHLQVRSEKLGNTLR